ncbi:hypothetical protein [Georgenia sp. H159]|uniref:hypothetical protein n=1 Tax=Georgenia sp. H159 TaxID=3076115 RepID=UPI003A5CCDFC
MFEEKISSRLTHRPGLAHPLEFMRDGIDTLAVWRLYGLDRSKDTLTVADDPSDRRTGLYVLTGMLAGTYSLTGEGEVSPSRSAALEPSDRGSRSAFLHERSPAPTAGRGGKVLLHDDGLPSPSSTHS